MDWREPFEDARATIYVLNSALEIVYCNKAWDRFAIENAGAHLMRESQIGQDVLALTPAPLKKFYAQMFGGVLTTGITSDWVYECSSDRQFRRFHMHVARRRSVDMTPNLVVSNALLIEQDLAPEHLSTDLKGVEDKNGLICMCCHCRRTRLPGQQDLWVFVPELIRSMPLNVSHSICPPCFGTHYAK